MGVRSHTITRPINQKCFHQVFFASIQRVQVNITRFRRTYPPLQSNQSYTDQHRCRKYLKPSKRSKPEKKILYCTQNIQACQFRDHHGESRWGC